jgi:predicted nuclease with TOPRIM domain
VYQQRVADYIEKGKDDVQKRIKLENEIKELRERLVQKQKRLIEAEKENARLEIEASRYQKKNMNLREMVSERDESLQDYETMLFDILFAR